MLSPVWIKALLSPLYGFPPSFMCWYRLSCLIVSDSSISGWRYGYLDGEEGAICIALHWYIKMCAIHRSLFSLLLGLIGRHVSDIFFTCQIFGIRLSF